MESLILVDIQNDFLPGGALPVPRGDEVIPVANALMRKFGLVVATADWHPVGHVSFASSHAGRKPGDVVMAGGVEQVLWPDHCVQGTEGAEFAPGLDASRIDRIVYKGTDPEIDSYSGFYDNGHRRSTELHQYFAQPQGGCHLCYGVSHRLLREVHGAGRHRPGLHRLPGDGRVQGVDVNPGDVDRAIQEMAESGVRIVTSADLLG